MIVKATSGNIKEAANVIKSGGLVAFPTETVYGLGADGLNPLAAAKIFEIKNRPAFNPLILHICCNEQLNKIAHLIREETVTKLIENFWPGPLTLVLPKKEIVPDIITSGNDTVAVRMPQHPVAYELIKSADTPIAAPSANKFSNLSPTEASHVEKQFGSEIELILDGGKCSVGVESTILQIKKDEINLLRPGGITIDELEDKIGEIKYDKKSTNSPVAPGQLPFHYAPKIPLYFFEEENYKKYKDKKIGALFFRQKTIEYNFNSVKILSPEGNLRKAAANLFTCLHEFENENVDLIFVEKLEEIGLGIAIMDRLKKATKKYE